MSLAACTIAAVEFAIDKERIPARGGPQCFSRRVIGTKSDPRRNPRRDSRTPLGIYTRESATMVQQARPRGPVQNAKQALTLLFLLRPCFDI